MSTNQPPEYLAAEKRYSVAKNNREKIEALEEMIRTMPKHKSAEKMRANIRSRYKKLKENIEKERQQKKGRGFQLSVKKEADAQICLVGTTQSGKSMLLNKLTNVIAVKAAISNTVGASTLYIPLNFSIDGRMYRVDDVERRKKKTETETIDHLLGHYKSVNLIKMDIQGWEEKALEGAVKTISKNPKLCLIIELWPKGLKEAGADPLKFLKSLENQGFNIYLINELKGSLKQMFDLPKLINETDAGIGGFVDLICSRQKLRPNFKN